MALSILPRQQQQKQSGILGTLGTLASLGGTLTGQPWLTTLGMGMRGLDGVLNGGSTSTGGNAQTAGGTATDWEEILSKLKEGWKNPASGNVAKSADEQAREEIANRIGKDSTKWQLGVNWGGIAQPVATAANSVDTAQTQWPSPLDYGYGIFGSKGCVVPPDYWRY